MSIGRAGCDVALFLLIHRAEKHVFQQESNHSRQERANMSMHDLVYVGFNSRVAAIDRETGAIVWSWQAPRPKFGGFVTLLLDGDRLIVSVMGYMYCLVPETGEQLWMN